MADPLARLHAAVERWDTKVVCPRCSGTGSEPGRHPYACYGCDGTGRWSETGADRVHAVVRELLAVAEAAECVASTPSTPASVRHELNGPLAALDRAIAERLPEEP